MDPQILIPVLVFLSVASVGGAVLAARAARLRVIQSRLGDAPGPAVGRRAAPSGSVAVEILRRTGAALSPRQASGHLQTWLIGAGFYTPAAVHVYLGVKLAMLIAGVTGAALVVLPLALPPAAKLMIAIAAGLAAALLPTAVVQLRRRRRATEVRQHLPDAIDMLEICISAGMGLDRAWTAVGEEIRRINPTLADEMALANLEMHLGAERTTAMRHMADRTGSDDLLSLVGVLVQSERFGTSIADALRTFAVTVRETRSMRAAEAAEQLSVKMLFPMVLFILPAILIVMGGGAILRIIQMFQSL